MADEVQRLGVIERLGVIAPPQNTFDTRLSAQEEQSFATWKNQYAPQDSGADYDLRGAFKAGLVPDAATGHWPDTFKKPNHPTFSDQSMYATGANAAKAGRWEGEKFMPPAGGGEQVERLGVVVPQQAGSPAKPAGFLDRLWQGIADPAYGIAQGAQHAFGTQAAYEAGPYMPEGTDASKLASDSTQAMDQKIQRRESVYDERRRQGVAGANDPEAAMVQPSLDTDWARLLGNVVGSAPLAAATPPGLGAVPAGSGMLARLGGAATAGAVGGAIGGAAQPVTQPGNFAGQKAMQTGLGAAGGAVAGPVGSLIGQGASAAKNAILPGLTPERQAIGQFARGVGIPTRGVKSENSLAGMEDKILEGRNIIYGNRDQLKLSTPSGGEVTGRVPETRRQFAEAIDQSKDRLWSDMDKAFNRADAGTISPGDSTIIKFNRALENSQLAETQARAEVAAANADLAGAHARQLQNLEGAAGKSANTDYRKAMTSLGRANRKLDSATVAKEAAMKDIQRPSVDLKSIVHELNDFADNVTTRLGPQGESAANYAKRRASAFMNDEAMTAREAQQAIKNYNAALNGFYGKDTSYENYSHLAIDAMIANKLREGLDQMVEKMTGTGIQGLKQQYGALSAIDKAVTRSALRGENKSDPLLDHLFTASSAADVIQGLAGHPGAAVRGAAQLIGRWLQRRLNSPDRAVRQFFQGASPQMEITPSRLPGVAGGAAANRYQPIGKGEVRRYSAPPAMEFTRSGVP